MRYQVPQFIEIEDKIIGPLTIKQFVYLVGGGGMAFIFYTFLPIYISIFLIAGIIPLSLALAFYKINNKPFIDFLESAFVYYTKQNLYIWKKETRNKAIATTAPDTTVNQIYVPRLSDSKLKELSWSLDINENLNPLTGEGGKNTK
ncbi:MAG: PrgI family protein [Candidatus Zambryskibacteria bacterium]|nr:PrgI family protein [Candidatus Zambryskibacteria bacterium]